MSSKATGWAWDQDLPVQRKCVLLWLAERATDNGVCFPGQAEIRQRTGLSESMVRRYLHWLASDQDDNGKPKRPVVRIIHRPIACDRNTSNVYVLLVPWAIPSDVQHELEELKYIPSTALEGVGCMDAPQGTGRQTRTPVGSTGAPQVGGAGAREEPSLPDRYRNHSPVPPTAKQQQQGELLDKTHADDDLTSVTEAHQDQETADALVAAFYRGLVGESAAVTASIRRRDSVIARQLVTAGATAAEAEVYARDMSMVSGRIAPVDLRSFERERLGWLARRRGTEQARGRHVDRTGQPPSWLAPLENTPTTMARSEPTQPQDETVPASQTMVDLAGDRLTERLRALLPGAHK